LKDLDNLQETISQSLKYNKTLLEEIQKNFASNFELMARNITSLNERLENLTN
jgi:hypothetical protein